MGELEERLEAIYTTIQKERMADIPILNPRLQVRAVGFREWEGHRLGVLVTPWFMNILLLPGEDGEWSTLACGEKVTQRLPSGVYEFIVGEEVDLGHYQMCSLFSPMFEFEDQAAALATARAVMDGVLDENNRDEVSTREREIQRVWNGEVEAPDESLPQAEGGEADAARATPDEDAVRPPAEAAPMESLAERPLSRRDLLRGAFLRR